MKRAIVAFVIQNRYTVTKQSILSLLETTGPTKEYCQSDNIHQLKSDLIKKTEETEHLKEKIKAITLKDKKSDTFLNPRKTFKYARNLRTVTPVSVSNKFHVLKDQSSESNSNVDLAGETDLTRVTSRCHRAKSYINSPNHILSDEFKNEVRNRRKIVIMADSHGRRLGGAVQELVCGKVVAYVKPGADFSAVVDDFRSVTGGLGCEDTLVIVAGTNNIDTSTDGNDLLAQVKVLIDETQHTNVIIASIPARYDSPWLNTIISRINNKLYDLVTHWEHVSFLPIHNMFRYFHTTHGLHFNWQGKKNIAKAIAQLINETNMLQVQQLNCRRSATETNCLAYTNACQTSPLSAARNCEQSTVPMSCQRSADGDLSAHTLSPFLERLDIFPPLT